MGKIHSKTFLSIIDIYGRVVQSKTFTNHQLLHFALEEPAGVYVLILDSKNVKSVLRIIKE